MNPVMLCRCEDITLEEVEKVLADGFTEFEEIKRYLRLGMGPCQGRTCLPLLRSMLARINKTDVANIDIPTNRPPNALLSFGDIKKYSEGEHSAK